MSLKKVLFVVIFYVLNFNSIKAIEPDVFVQSTVNRASQILSKDISKEEKMDQLEIIAKETVDITGIGFYSLGSARKVLNDEQKKKYSKLFEDYFLKNILQITLNIFFFDYHLILFFLILKNKIQPQLYPQFL